MQVACPSCSAEYPVDERRLPASGLKMRCPKCGSRFHVHADGRVEDAAPARPLAPSVPKPQSIPRPRSVPRPGAPKVPKPPGVSAPAGVFGGDEELDLPAPRGAAPKPPAAADSGLDLPAPRRPKKPIAPPLPPAGAPAPKRRPLAPPVGSPSRDLDLPAPRAPSAKKPLAPPLDDFDLDLPAAKKPMVDESRKPLAPPADDFDLDLPAAKKKPLAPPLDDFDLDLPAPAGAAPSSLDDFDLDLPAPKRPLSPAMPDGLDLDLPAPKAGPGAGGDDFDLDLPAPVATRAPALADEGRNPFDDLDLPSAKSAADLPTLKAFGDVDLPKPKSVLEQADEAFGDLDLPMPKSAAARIDSFDDGFEGLDLPIPKANADLPAPKGAGFGDLELPDPRSDELGFGELDLPTPRSMTDLPAVAEHSDLPAISGGTDLPAPKSFGELDDLALPEPRPLPAVDPGYDQDPGGPSVEGSSVGAGVGGVGFGELDLGASSDVDDMEFADIPQAEGDRDSLPPLRAPVTGKKGQTAPDKPKKSKAAWIALGVLVVLLGGGAALGLTPYGPFGMNLLEPFMPGAGDPAQVEAAIRAAEEEAQSDRWADVRHSLVTLGNARREAGINKRMLARSLLHEGLYRVRFGNTGVATHASAIRSRMVEHDMSGPGVSLAFAAAALGEGNAAAARSALGPALSSAGTDAYVHLVAGEIELAEGNLEEAATAFAAAAEGGAGARGLWGVARARIAGDDPAATRAAIAAVLSVSPDHGEALVALARTTLEDGDQDAALATARRAAGQSEEQLGTSPMARADAWALIGQVQESRGRQTLALEAYEGALQAVDAHVGALLGAGRVLLADRPSDALPRFDSVLHAEGTDSHVLPSGRTARQEAQLGSARAMLSLDRAQEAKAVLDGLAAELEEDGEVLLWLGKAEMALDPPNHGAAEQQFRAAIQAAPQMFEAYLALADLFFETDRGSDAGAILERAVSQVEETAEMRLQLGQFELRRNEHADAIRELRRALVLDPELPPALFALGVAQRRSGQLSGADASFDRLATIDNGYPGLSLERGLLFEARGESDRAVSAYELALEASPDDMDLLLRLGAAQVAANRIDDAEGTLERVRESRPNSAEANHFVGRVAFARGNYAEALNHFRRAIQIDPSRGEFHLYVGWAAFENQQLGEALHGVNAAIERDPSLGDAYWIRGAIKLRSGRPADALQDLERALQLRPSRYEIYAAMGETYDQLRRGREAVEAYRQATSHIDDNGEWFYRLGRLQLDRGDTSDAAAALQRATLLGDAMAPAPAWLADAHRVRGEVLRLLGNGREAIPHYRRYLELAPSGAIDRREIRQRLMDLGEVPPN